MNHVTKSRDNLVAALMDLGKKRDDLYMRHVWACMQHFVFVYHTDQNMRDLAKQMPEQLKKKMAA